MRKLKVGIIGLGRIASLYETDKRARKYYPALTHAGAYSLHKAVKITCGADVNRNRAALFGKRWGVKSLYTDYRKMLREQEIDILSICTPPEEHVAIIRETAGRVPVIFCEKPFTCSLNEIREVIKLCSRWGTRITVNLYRQYDLSHDKVKDLLKSGAFGGIQRINCYYGKGLRNIGSHAIGYIIGVFGKPSVVRVLSKKKYEGTDEFSFDVYMKLRHNVPVFMQSCDFSRYRLFEFDIICERGRVQILDEGLTIKVFFVKDNRAETGAMELREKKGAINSSIGKALYNAVCHLVNMRIDKKVKPIVSPEVYFDIQKVIEEIEKKGMEL
ncbi:MAG: Gfo/Idh/MocA family oxidoreductase [Candidatus Omnitrophota bacterium]|jgi:predicted dehydrogenase